MRRLHCGWSQFEIGDGEFSAADPDWRRYARYQSLARRRYHRASATLCQPRSFDHARLLRVWSRLPSPSLQADYPPRLPWAGLRIRKRKPSPIMSTSTLPYTCTVAVYWSGGGESGNPCRGPHATRAAASARHRDPARPHWRGVPGTATLLLLVDALVPHLHGATPRTHADALAQSLTIWSATAPARPPPRVCMASCHTRLRIRLLHTSTSSVVVSVQVRPAAGPGAESGRKQVGQGGAWAPWRRGGRRPGGRCVGSTRGDGCGDERRPEHGRRGRSAGRRHRAGSAPPAVLRPAVQHQEPCVVHHEPALAAPLLGRPPDPPVPRAALQRCNCPSQDGQPPPVGLDHVLPAFAYRLAPPEVVPPSYQLVPARRLARSNRAHVTARRSLPTPLLPESCSASYHRGR